MVVATGNLLGSMPEMWKCEMWNVLHLYHEFSWEYVNIVCYRQPCLITFEIYLTKKHELDKKSTVYIPLVK